MSWILLLSILGVFTAVVKTNDDPKFEKTTHFVQKGDSTSLTCRLNSGTEFLIQKQLAITHKNFKTGTNERITYQGALTEAYEDKSSSYNVAFAHTPKIVVTLKLTGVTDDMDGQYFCIVMSGDTVLETTDTNVTVVGGIENMELTIGNSIVREMDQELEFREGLIPIVCKVSGANPEPVIHLMLNDEMLPADMTVIMDIDDPMPRRTYSASATYNLEYTTSHFGAKITCHGETPPPPGFTGNLMDKTASAMLEGIVDEPVIYCTNNTAGKNDKKVKLQCLVSIKPPVKAVFFRMRDQNNKYDKLILNPGNKTASMTECYKEEFNATFEAYVLRFYKMEPWHFTSNIYFEVVGFDDMVHQRSVYLIKADDNDDVSAAPSLTATITLPVLCLLAVLLNSLI